MPEILAKPAEPSAVQYSLRPRLTVVAPDAAEAVRQAGGWLFDRTMAGWDVTVITASAGDPRPLRILGARARGLDTLLEVPVPGPCLQAVAVRTDLYQAYPRVRQMVLAASAAADGEIRLWGEDWPGDFGEAAGVVSHRPSMAARAFKAQALRAAGVAGPAGVPDAGAPEVFRLGGARRHVSAAAI